LPDQLRLIRAAGAVFGFSGTFGSALLARRWSPVTVRRRDAGHEMRSHETFGIRIVSFLVPVSRECLSGGPLPGGHLPDRVQVGVGLRPGVLLGHASAELDMLADGLAERFIVRQADLIKCLTV
jgi:hypothetical protein